MKLNLSCSDNHKQGYVNVDIVSPADIITDLNRWWPWEDNSIDEIVAYDAIEHYKNPIHTMNEAWRVLVPNGIFAIEVPTTDGRGAWQEPQHCSYWNRNSFFYYTHGDPHRERFGDAYGVKARFKVIEEKQVELVDKVTKLYIKLMAVK